jgi:hypothetical protein
MADSTTATDGIRFPRGSKDAAREMRPCRSVAAGRIDHRSGTEERARAGATVPDHVVSGRERHIMRRLSVALGVAGLILTAVLPARAAEVTLFGKKYNIAMESRGQTFKNGIRVVLPEAGNRKAGLFFEEGADPSQDRLWVAAPITNDETVTGHQLYALRGTDANGMFTAASAEVEEYFGGNQNMLRAGRPINVVVVNRENTGVKQDRNVLTMSFYDDDAYRLYDLDTMSGNRADVALFSRVRKSQAVSVGDAGEMEADPNLPDGAFNAFAPGPNGTVLVIAGGAGRTGAEVGVWDVKKNDAFPCLTNITNVTANATNPLPGETEDGIFLEPHALARFSADEYWFLYSNNLDGDNDFADSNRLVRMRLTFPADLATAAADSIKAEILGIEELKGGAVTGASEGGQYGLAIGREVNGGRRIYLADWAGNLYTLTPVP